MQHPSSPSATRESLADLSWSSVLRGAVLDNVLTLAALIPVMFYFAGSDAFSDDPRVVDEAFADAGADPLFLACMFAIGLPITVYSAFWAARRAGRLFERHGGWTAVASAVIASLFLLLPGADGEPANPLWYDALSLALMLPAGVLGGWLASESVTPAA